MIQIRHKSDCALRNAPSKPCDCGGEKTMLSSLYELLRRGDNLVQAIESGENLAISNADFKIGLVMIRQTIIEDRKDENSS